MRQVFTSPRLENVEAVAELLRAEGIEVRISNDRSYKGNRRRSFSYRDSGDTSNQPAVWIVRAEDQPRGRQLLREAGLLESSRSGESSYLPLSALQDPAARPKSARVTRIRIVLLGLIAVGIGLVVFTAHRTVETPARADAPAAPQANAAPAIVPQLAEEVEAFRIDVPAALARHLAAGEAAGRQAARACLAVDGKDPAPAVLEGMDAGTRWFAASACPQGALRIAVQDYVTDGSGTGTVQLAVEGGGARSLRVERIETRWRVLGGD